MHRPTVCLWIVLAGVAGADRALLDSPVSDPPERLWGGVTTHVVQRGQSLRSIGSRAGVDPRVIASMNGLRGTDVVKPDQRLAIDNRHIVPLMDEGTITVNVPQRMLFFRADGALFAAPIAVGSRGWRTPLGPFTIVEKEEDPTWDVPASIAAEARAKGKSLPAKVPPGPDNPLGRYWLRLSVGGVGIHGTNVPTSLYQTVTHGCIRLHPEDIERLFGAVVAGTPGQVVYEPVLLTVERGEVYLEVHPDAYGLLARAVAAIVRERATAVGVFDLVDWPEADRVAAAREGIARVVTRRKPLGSSAWSGEKPGRPAAARQFLRKIWTSSVGRRLALFNVVHVRTPGGEEECRSCLLRRSDGSSCSFTPSSGRCLACA